MGPSGPSIHLTRAIQIHPSQRANWLALMREMGRLMAAHEWERIHGSKGKNDKTKGSGGIRQILQRPPKRAVD
jgi:hypothetical protein